MVSFGFIVSESPSADLASLTFWGLGFFVFFHFVFKKRCVSGPQSSVSYLKPSDQDKRTEPRATVQPEGQAIDFDSNPGCWKGRSCRC